VALSRWVLVRVVIRRKLLNLWIKARTPTYFILKNLILLFSAVTIGSSCGFSQTLKEELIISDTKDSVLLKAESMHFDTNGEYLFKVKEHDGHYFISRAGKSEAMRSRWGSSVSLVTSKSDENKKFYECSATRLFGPISGTDIAKFRHPESANSKHVAVPSLEKDSIAIYIDGAMVMKIDTRSSQEMEIDSKKASPLEAKKASFNSSDWLSFSNNGNYIMSVENGLKYRLFVNGKQIDSSDYEFYQMRINDKGDYIYAKGRPPHKNEDKRYSYMFFLHAHDTVLGYVRTAWECDLKEHGGYYYSGDDNGTDYIAVNNMLFRKLESISNITLLDDKHFLFTAKENGKQKINVNGKMYEADCREILNPSLDSKGNFAYYGIKDYYLYKYINGKQQAEAISKYKVRATPLYISPTGSSLHYFKTDDSTYIYQDEKLLFPPISRSKLFSVQPHSEVLPSTFVRGEAGHGLSLLYVEIDTTAYFVLNGFFSKPMKPVAENSYTQAKKTGELVAGKIDENGFYVIQKTGENKFHVNINNTVYKELEGPHEIIKGSCTFDGKQLVFFGIKGLSFYKYTVTI
jgi:hypothetical protein